MKVKIVDYYVVNKSKPTQRIIFDVKIMEGNGGLNNKKFVNEDRDLSFIVKSTGHLNPFVENHYPLTVAIDNDGKLDDYKNQIFFEIT